MLERLNQYYVLLQSETLHPGSIFQIHPPFCESSEDLNPRIIGSTERKTTLSVYPYLYIYIYTLHCITLHYTTLHYIIYITLYTLHYITLHYITLHTYRHTHPPYHTTPHHTIPHHTIHTYIYIYTYDMYIMLDPNSNSRL